MKAPRIYKWEDDVRIITETVIEYVEVPGTGGETPTIPTNNDIKTPTEYLQYNKLIETKDKTKQLTFPTVYPDNYFNPSDRGNTFADGAFDITLDDWDGTTANKYFVVSRLRDLAGASAYQDSYKNSFIEITPVGLWGSSTWLSVVIVKHNINVLDVQPNFVATGVPAATPLTIDSQSASSGLTLTIPITNFLSSIDTDSDPRFLCVVGYGGPSFKIGVYSDNENLAINTLITAGNGFDVLSTTGNTPYVYVPQ